MMPQSTRISPRRFCDFAMLGLLLLLGSGAGASGGRGRRGCRDGEYITFGGRLATSGAGGVRGQIRGCRRGFGGEGENRAGVADV